MNLCALQRQRDVRDLARLQGLSEIAWLEPDELAACPEPAVLAGFWLQDDPPAARQVLRARAVAGANTLLVPRLPNLNYASHVNAPAALEVLHKTFQEVYLEADRAYSVSGQAIIKSPLAHGKWGISEFGQSVVLAFRATEDLGWIIFCTASICSRTVGVTPDEQLELLRAILGRAAATSVFKGTDTGTQPIQRAPVDVETLLAEQAQTAVPWLLALLCAGGKHDEKQVRRAAAKLGLVLDDSLSLSCIPDCPADRLVEVLNKRGWGAYARRVRQIQQ
jgi:hypothetical protein